MAKVEPYVHVQERVREFPARLDIDDSTNIGGVVVSPKGKPYQYISGPNDFLKKLVGADELPRNSHISLINAYYCSYFAGLVIARSLNTKAVSAIRIPLSTDGSINPKLLVNGDSYIRYPEGDSIIIDVPYYSWITKTNELVCTTELNLPNSGMASKPNLNNSVISRIISNDNIQVNNNGFTKSDRILTIGRDTYLIFTSNQVSDVVLYYKPSGAIPVPQVGDKVYYVSNSIAIDSVSEGSITVDGRSYELIDKTVVLNGITYFLWMDDSENIVYTVTVLPTTNDLVFRDLFNEVDYSIDDSDYYIKMLGESFLNSYAELTVSLPNSDWAVRINDTLLYQGSDNFLENEVAIDPVFEADFNKLIKEEVTSIYDVIAIINSWSGFNAYTKGTPLNDNNASIGIDFSTPNGEKPSNLLKIYTSNTIAGSQVIKFSNSGSPSNYQINEPENYLLIQLTEPSNKDEWLVNLIPTSSQMGVSKLSFSSDGGLKYSRFDVSINKDAKDESGNNCFIENLNPQLDGIQFYVVGDFDFSRSTIYPEFHSMLFGDSGVDLTMCKKSACFSSAIYALEEQKQYRIEYLSTFGVTDSTYLKDYQYVGNNNYWFAPIDVPYNYTTQTSIAIFSNAINDNNNEFVLGPFDKNTAFLGWPCYIAGSSKYYERVFINKSNNSEYAPTFEQTNGVLTYSNPVLLLNASDRTALLNGTAGPCVWVVYNQALNIYYLNDNWCHTTTNNIMSEEMNRRMINRIKKDSVQLMNQFKGRVNTTSTRARVVELLTIYMNNNIMSQNYKPDEYQIICDETNNTVDIITANKLAVTLRVRLLGSIKYIEVLADIFPLGIDFES